MNEVRFALALVFCAGLTAGALLGSAYCTMPASPRAPSVNSTPHVVEEKMGGSAVRIDDFDRKVTCWVFSTGVSCLPFRETRAPSEP